VRQAESLLAFVDTLRAGSDDRVLVIGDLNANGQEDPIRTLTDGGLVNEIARFIPSPYSFIFDGQAGYLDHALTTSALSATVTGVTEWHVNADEPEFLDYNTEDRPDDLFSPTPFRSSDHDPVIIGFDL
jgi:predicted extracellular nuclease